jgi:hypothetical protein
MAVLLVHDAIHEHLPRDCDALIWAFLRELCQRAGSKANIAGVGGQSVERPTCAGVETGELSEWNGADQLQSLLEAEFVGNRMGPARWVLNLRCSLLSLVRLHSPDCERCNTHETHGDEMRKRLEELSWRTQPRSLNRLNHGDHEEVVEVFDSKPGEVVASQPASLKPEQRKTA